MDLQSVVIGAFIGEAICIACDVFGRNFAVCDVAERLGAFPCLEMPALHVASQKLLASKHFGAVRALWLWLLNSNLGGFYFGCCCCLYWFLVVVVVCIGFWLLLLFVLVFGCCCCWGCRFSCL